MSSSGLRIRLALTAITGAALLFFAGRNATMGGVGLTEGLAFAVAMYSIPFAVFAMVIWSNGWTERSGRAHPLALRRWISLIAETTALISGSLFLLTLPCTSYIAEHTSLAGCWIWAGIVSAAIAGLCSIAGSPRRGVQGLLSALLVPCWVFAAALFAKMAMD